MYYKNYAEPYYDFQEPEIEVVLKKTETNEEEEKIIIWYFDFTEIVY